jgi:hypothetical protein
VGSERRERHSNHPLSFPTWSGIHGLTFWFQPRRSDLLMVQTMDSRLRGNDNEGERAQAMRASFKFQQQCHIISREGAKGVAFANYPLLIFAFFA